MTKKVQSKHEKVHFHVQNNPSCCHFRNLLTCLLKIQRLTMNSKAEKNLDNQLSSSKPEPESSGFHQRLSSLLPAFKSVRAFATASGVSQTGLQRLINGGEPTLSTLVALAKAGGVSVEWLATGEGPSPKDQVTSSSKNDCPCHDTLGNPVDLSEFVFIPRYNLKAAAGHGAAVAGEKPMFSMSFRRYWIDNFLRIDPKDLSVLSVKGDSMEGVLNDRDVILVNHADTSPTTGLYVLRIEGDLLVKRVQKLIGGRLKILSANESYEPFEVDLNNPGGDFAVVGRVVWFGRQL
ncbi:XRE family transcriptional regulator [Aquitalea pelogenes]|uniref:XRE family transcriptional regulator n=1 Tax=Aquitalea pelogenes TaxID=1293573 RepID=UPI001EFB1D22|nr:helix-turn-helix transcriptional regulator [Aquitalea pelogenes]